MFLNVLIFSFYWPRNDKDWELFLEDIRETDLRRYADRITKFNYFYDIRFTSKSFSHRYL